MAVGHAAHMASAGSGAANTDALEAAKKEIEGEMKALQEGLSLKKTVWDGEVAAHKMSAEQELASVMAATNKEYEGELALLQKEKALPGQKLEAIQEVNNKIEQLQAAHQLKMVKLDQDSLAGETASWQNFADTITTSFNSQLKGLITGTTNFNKAFKSIADDMAVKFIEVVENMVVKWAVGQLAQTTATTTGAAARAAAEASSSTAASAGTILTILHSITASAAETFWRHLRLSVARPRSRGGGPRRRRGGDRACRRRRPRNGRLGAAERHACPAASGRDGRARRRHAMGARGDFRRRQHARREHGACQSRDELQRQHHGCALVQFLCDGQPQSARPRDQRGASAPAPTSGCPRSAGQRRFRQRSGKWPICM
ncbi:MAG: hypothetical protein WBE85_11465 [Methylocella sp.]